MRYLNTQFGENSVNNNSKDKTCLMGDLQLKDNGVRICFNSAKSWILGWYSKSHLVVQADNISDGLYKVFSFENIDRVEADDEHATIQITKSR